MKYTGMKAAHAEIGPRICLIDGIYYCGGDPDAAETGEGFTAESAYAAWKEREELRTGLRDIWADCMHHKKPKLSFLKSAWSHLRGERANK